MIGSLGDSIVTIPAFRAVRRHFADAEIVMLQNTPSQNLVLASQVIPEGLLDRTVSYASDGGSSSKILEYAKTWSSIRREKFDAAVYLAGSARTARTIARDKLFFRSIGIKELIGFHAFSDEKIYPVEPDGHPAAAESEARLKLERLRQDGVEAIDRDTDTPLIDLTDEEVRSITQWLGDHGLDPGTPFVTIAPGCKKEADRWPMENFVELGKRFCEKFPYIPVIAGGSSEEEMGERLVSEWGRGINAAGSFSVRESAALLSLSKLHIGLDTGTTHLAAAAGTPCFVIFGDKTNHGTWYPLGEGHTVVYHRVPCAGCRKFECPLETHPCMKDMTVDAVWHELSAAVNDIEISHKGIRVVAI